MEDKKVIKTAIHLVDAEMIKQNFLLIEGGALSMQSNQIKRIIIKSLGLDCTLSELDSIVLTEPEKRLLNYNNELAENVVNQHCKSHSRGKTIFVEVLETMYQALSQKKSNHKTYQQA